LAGHNRPIGPVVSIVVAPFALVKPQHLVLPSAQVLT
jgi:hypothetical protein